MTDWNRIVDSFVVLVGPIHFRCYIDVLVVAAAATVLLAVLRQPIVRRVPILPPRPVYAHHRYAALVSFGHYYNDCYHHYHSAGSCSNWAYYYQILHYCYWRSVNSLRCGWVSWVELDPCSLVIHLEVADVSHSMPKCGCGPNSNVLEYSSL